MANFKRKAKPDPWAAETARCQDKFDLLADINERRQSKDIGVRVAAGRQYRKLLVTKYQGQMFGDQHPHNLSWNPDGKRRACGSGMKADRISSALSAKGRIVCHG